MLYDVSTEEIVSFYKWAYANNWRYDGRNIWKFFFMGGTAMSNAAYNKHYKKTSEQLLEIYRNNIQSHNKKV